MWVMLRVKTRGYENQQTAKPRMGRHESDSNSCRPFRTIHSRGRIPWVYTMATTYRHFVANPDSRAVLQTLHRQTAVDIDHLPGRVGHVTASHRGGQFADVLRQAPAFFDEQFRVVDQVVVFFSDA